MSRSFHTLTRQQAAAFDFDVVSDVPARPAPHPKPEPEKAPPESRTALREKTDA